MKNKKILILIIAIILIIFTAVIIKNYKTKTSLKYQNQEIENLNLEKQDIVSENAVEEAKKDERKIDENILKITKSDFVLGDENAPITIIEYASLSCPHCASFYREAFEDLKKDFIDTKKVKFIYRDFPLNQQALAASMIAFCRADLAKENKSEIYHSFIKALFKTQDSWAFDAKYIEKLQAIAALDEMSEDSFKKCLENKKLQEKILTNRILAAKSLNINSTPTFFINNQVMEGYIDYKTIKKAIEKI